MYNYYKYDRELSQEEQDDHNKLIELKLQHKREALARKYKDKVLKFIDSVSDICILTHLISIRAIQSYRRMSTTSGFTKGTRILPSLSILRRDTF